MAAGRRVRELPSGRSLPIDARQTMAMTVDEWNTVCDRHWQERGEGALVAEQDGRVVATGSYACGTGQFTVVVEPEAREATDAREPRICRLALVSTCGATEEDALRRTGLAPGEEFGLLCKRIARPVREGVIARAGIPITGGVNRAGRRGRGAMRHAGCGQEKVTAPG